MILNKLKQLTKDTAIYGISTIVGRFLSFLLVPFYTNIFHPAEYGIIANIYIFIGIFNIVYVYGMDAAYLKYAGLPSSGNDKDNFSTPYLSVFIAGVIISILMIMLRGEVFGLLDVPVNYYYLMFYSAGVLFLDSVTVIPFIQLRLQRKAKKFAAFKLINIGVNIVLNLVLILKYKMGIEAVLISNLFASLSSLILLLPAIFRNLRIRFNKDLFKKLLKFGLPYLPAGLSSMLIQGIDRPILGKLTSLDTVGIYNACYKLGIFMMLFVNMFQYAWQPFFLQNAEEKNAKEIFSKVLTYFTLVSALILVILSLFIDNIVAIPIYHGRTLIDPAYWGGLSIVPIILFGYLFNGLYVIFTAGIYIEEKSIYIPLITGIGAAVNIGVNFLLIPAWGIMGAALATLFAYLVMAAGLYIVTQKFYKINYEIAKLTRIFFAILVVGGIYYYLLYSNQLILVYKFLLFIFFTLFLYIFVFEKKEIDFLRTKLNILKQNRS
ncbi:MAG TPA: oligosaccharide flippase family protein [Ignavibacteriaceae bacterium]